MPYKALLTALNKALAEESIPASQLIRREDNPGRILHALCWLSYRALKSKKATLEEILGDETGILHAWGHKLDHGRWTEGMVKSYARRVGEIEGRLG